MNLSFFSKPTTAKDEALTNAHAVKSETTPTTPENEVNADEASGEEAKNGDVALTINGKTLLTIPEASVEGSIRNMSSWVDSVNEYFNLKDDTKKSDTHERDDSAESIETESRDAQTTKESQQPAKDSLRNNLSVTVNGAASKTLLMSQQFTEWFIVYWNEQVVPFTQEVREDPDVLKVKLNNMLEQLKNALPTIGNSSNESVRDEGIEVDELSCVMENEDEEAAAL
ncbi:predicted protein [Thalassiosira pseudonana CCMP1335]|uniref:Uncharacterized protein n=1 Tax=Thalassiosira pseudonana TaxID=35128 RepID=B5YLM9_THAPS|nr:predicted protein [Thalassiosira pseudonana CCMP1335]ACI64259.1 predicted protein [Thalassiosira pseudonana CCMP1335]|eukprot:scaffold2291_cov211-Alexandrium_tamarense.AAC.2